MLVAFGCSRIKVEPSENDLVFNDLATVWDEAMPLGNATVGELVWQKGDNLRLSLDRIDLWDLRPIEALKCEDYSFEWVKEHLRRGDYGPVTELFDKKAYTPIPSKIPGAALEIDISSWGPVLKNRLYLNNALCEVLWENGISMKTFVQADEDAGWMVFDNVPESFDIQLVPPEYQSSSLTLLGYSQGEVTREGNRKTYHQQGWKNYFYDVAVDWKRQGKKVIAAWSVTSSLSGKNAADEVAKAMAGLVQYGFSPTTSAWLGQHFYLHWKYSADHEFLKERAYPFIRDVALFLEQETEVKPNGTRSFEYSASPEINDNGIDAYFPEITNYDLALTKFAFVAAAEMADSLGFADEAGYWRKVESELPEFSLDEDGGLAI